MRSATRSRMRFPVAFGCFGARGFEESRFALNRLTTKFLLSAVHVELPAHIEWRRAWMDFQWTPRDHNNEADDTSNGSGTSPELI